VDLDMVDLWDHVRMKFRTSLGDNLLTPFNFTSIASDSDNDSGLVPGHTDVSGPSLHHQWIGDRGHCLAVPGLGGFLRVSSQVTNVTRHAILVLVAFVSHGQCHDSLGKTQQDTCCPYLRVCR
jgi:hypothetical protein